MTVGELIEYLEKFDKNKKVLGYRLDDECEDEYDGDFYGENGLLFYPHFFQEGEIKDLEEEDGLLKQEQEDGIILFITNKDGYEDFLDSDYSDESPCW